MKYGGHGHPFGFVLRGGPKDKCFPAVPAHDTKICFATGTGTGTVSLAGEGKKDGKREHKTRLTESTGKLIEEGRGKIGGEFALQASGNPRFYLYVSIHGSTDARS